VAAIVAVSAAAFVVDKSQRGSEPRFTAALSATGTASASAGAVFHGFTETCFLAFLSFQVATENLLPALLTISVGLKPVSCAFGLFGCG
jgi:hypothetical protein